MLRPALTAVGRALLQSARRVRALTRPQSGNTGPAYAHGRDHADDNDQGEDQDQEDEADEDEDALPTPVRRVLRDTAACTRVLVGRFLAQVQSSSTSVSSSSSSSLALVPATAHASSASSAAASAKVCAFAALVENAVSQALISIQHLHKHGVTAEAASTTSSSSFSSSSSSTSSSASNASEPANGSSGAMSAAATSSAAATAASATAAEDGADADSSGPDVMTEHRLLLNLLNVAHLPRLIGAFRAVLDALRALQATADDHSSASASSSTNSSSSTAHAAAAVVAACEELVRNTVPLLHQVRPLVYRVCRLLLLLLLFRG